MNKSIIIITYGRHEELIQTIKCILPYDNSDLQLLILDNNLENKLEVELNELFKCSKIRYEYFWEGKNYGVALGRNYLINRTDGDYIITLDDDIEIDDIFFLINKVEEYFKTSPHIGCLAFNIRNFYTRTSLSHEIPHGNKKLDFSNNLLTNYYIGAGHAIKKEVYEKAGIYPLDLGLYGGEELDLSFRIIDNDYEILYTSDIVVFHKVSPKGRMPSPEQAYLKFQNRLKVVYKYMPIKYVITNILVWSSYYLLKQKNVKNIIKALLSLKETERNTISSNAMNYLKKVNARLLY